MHDNTAKQNPPGPASAVAKPPAIQATPPAQTARPVRERGIPVLFKSRHFHLAAIALIALAWATTFLCWRGLIFERPRAEEPSIGRHLALGHGFRNPFSRSATAPPSSWSPPIYPLVVAAAYRIAGVESRGASVILGCVNIVSYALVAMAIYVLGRRWFSMGAGLIATALFLAHPMFLQITEIYWDAYMALAGFLWLTIAADTIWRRGPTALRLALLGAGMGLLVLTNASYVLAIPALVLIAIGRTTWRRRAALVALSILGFAIAQAPWTIRNYRVFHQLIFVRGGANLELWFGNLPDSSGWIGPIFILHHPGQDLYEQNLMLKMGEKAYFRYCGERFVEEYRSDPAGFWIRTAQRCGYLLLSDVSEPPNYPYMSNRTWHGIVVSRAIVNSLLMVLGFAGIWTGWRLGYRIGRPVALGVLAVIPFMITGVWDRHTMPLRAMLLLFTGLLLWAVWHRLVTGNWPTPQAERQTNTGEACL